MKLKTEWISDRLRQKVAVTRWGAVGTPLLVFPTAGGDAEEIERFLIIDTLADFLAEGRIKIYSCDSVAGRMMLGREGSPSDQMRALDLFQQFVRWELVPAIRADCQDPEIEVVATGASIGAFNALATVCRFPEVFRSALCMSGTYDLRRFLDGRPNENFYYASPLHYLPGLEGPILERLRSRFVLLASGEGKAEDIGESWRVADALGQKGVPNRVDSWGAEWDHDWPTWRNMLRRYVDELIPAVPSAGQA
ncbi:MAG: alpha/beta hydrolase-fold protein [Gemmatimonadota bacterium]